jgi:hypothetical protein
MRSKAINGLHSAEVVKRGIPEKRKPMPARWVLADKLPPNYLAVVTVPQRFLKRVCGMYVVGWFNLKKCAAVGTFENELC